MTLPPAPTETTTPTSRDQPLSPGPATPSAPVLNLRFFTQPDILLKIGCRRLARLLEPFSQELMPLNLPQPPDADEDPIYPPALAAALAASEPTLPFAVAKVLLTIEAAAAPENLVRLHEISLRYFPNLNPTIHCPLSRALDVWLFYPEQLAPFAPAEPAQQLATPADSAISPICHKPPAASSVDTIQPDRNSQNEGGAPAPFSSPETAQQPTVPADSAISHPAICHEQPATPPGHLDHPYTNAPTTDAEAFRKLAHLTPAEYDRVRCTQANRLRVRATTLDNEVARCRAQLDVERNALNLPRVVPWPEPVSDIGPVLSAVSERYALYLVLPDGAADAFALWSGHTHVPEAFHQTPRLNLRSPAGGCGKTTTLDVLATMSACPLRTESLSAAVLFRLVDQYQPTLLLDEVDAYIHQSEELRGLLNAGHKRGACAYRCEGEGKTVRAFKAFAPAALAGLGPLPATLHDRSIVIPLLAAQDGAIQKRFDPLDIKIETELAQKLARWAKDNRDALSACEPPLPPGAFNRLADNWRPLFAIAQLAGGDWPARAHAAYAKLTPKITSNQSATETLLHDIRQIFLDLNAPRLFSKTLVAHLNAGPQTGPRTFQPAATPERTRLPITQARLARHLAAVGIYPKLMRIATQRGKGYELADFTPIPPSNGSSSPPSVNPDNPQNQSLPQPLTP